MNKQNSFDISHIVYIFVGGLLAVLIGQLLGVSQGDVIRWGKEYLYWPLMYVVKDRIFTPIFVIAISVILALERLFPAKRDQKIFGLHFVQDFVWMFFEFVLHTVVITTYVTWMKAMYTEHLNWLSLEMVRAWPWWLKFVWGVLVLDFLRWLQHYLHHRFSLLWNFHAVHHSQTQLNVFTDMRYHVLEYMVRHTVIAIPFLILTLDAPTIIYFTVFHTWYTRFYHANIRWNLGPLRYVLVTPQSHRIHHSVEPRHRDKNFGSLLCIWDFMFRTQYTGWDEYPDTGIEDEEFPMERTAKGLSLLLMPIIQMWYPFKVIWRKVRGG